MMKIAMIQMNIESGAIEHNRQHGLQLTEKAAAAGAEVIVLPELWTSGYSLRQVESFAEKEDGPTLRGLKRIAQQYNITIVGGSIAYRRDGAVYNHIPVFNGKGALTDYQKVHLFSLFKESRFFQSGDKLCLFSIGDWKVGVAICYDLRFPEMFRTLKLKGASVIFVPAEWPSIRGANWQVLAQARAVENQLFICAVNCVGQHKGQPFYGHSLLVGPDGTILAEGDDTEQILYGEVDQTAILQAEASMTVLQDRRPELYEGVEKR
ncbi:MAG: carbon-nitrogen family hydrolase [Sporomusaceae bacterium]|nr:carbon-nitrogen family hydrolase [Sporomusaceae bacterium]